MHVTLDVNFLEEVPYFVSPSSPIQGEMGSELEILKLENDVFEDTALEKEMPGSTEASDRSSIYENETCGLCEETTDHPLELDQSPISGDEAGALGVETTGHIKASDQLLVYENSDSDSCMLSSVCVPTKLQDALSNSKWMDTMNVEMDALNKNKTWDLVPFLEGKKAVGCIWVFTLKHKAQTYGVDYLETFAPVAKLNTVRVLLALVANHD
ncbi:unnamed protein product [Prunus brigantina]